MTTRGVFLSAILGLAGLIGAHHPASAADDLLKTPWDKVVEAAKRD